MKETKYAGTQTEKNLMAAFAGESEARNKYTYFASKAKKEGFEQIAALFLKTADNEKEHAKVQFTRDYTGEVSDGRYAARQIFHVMFKLSLVAATVVIIKSTTRRLSSKDTLSHVSR